MTERTPFFRNNVIIPRDGDDYLIREGDLAVFMDGYVILPREQYEALRQATEAPCVHS